MPSTKNPKKLPNNPGCYLFKSEKEEILYVGKAKDLKKRVLSYFGNKKRDSKTSALVKNINYIDYFVTENEIEALLLENSLIKKFYPKYNIDLKDSRRYAYLFLEDDDFPYFRVARTREKNGKYFGPFTSGRFRKEIEKVLERQFRILTKKASPLKRKTLEKEEYKNRLKKGIKILNGDVNKLIKELENEMKNASKKSNYEYAITLRNQIEALNYLKEKQNIELRRNYHADIINFKVIKDKVHLLLFNVYKGTLENKQEFEFDFSDEFLEEFIMRYYSTNKIPKELIISEKISDALIKFLQNKRKSIFEVIIPKKGAKKSLLNLVLKNVEIATNNFESKLEVLKDELNLIKLPRNIECFDISHLRGEDTVASMVYFKGGKEFKKNYRRFKIRSETKGDDYWAIKEVIYRRYAKTLKNSLEYPDLIIIDGGKGQLSSARSVLKSLKLDIPIISIAKREEEIYVPLKQKPLKLSKKNRALLLVMEIRDEAHRFAITYNRLLRKKKLLK